MGRIAWGRVLLGGIVAGILLNVLEFLLHGTILASAWKSAMLALGKTEEGMKAFQSTSMTLLVLWAFLVGLFGIWLYAAIRPRLGAGPRTGFVAGIATWFAVTLMPALVTMAFDLYPPDLVRTWVVGELVTVTLSVLVGAWFYREP
jgi:magnesium-transporting ATPase (P-type)